jgi:hypothetical protein
MKDERHLKQKLTGWREMVMIKTESRRKDESVAD